MKKSIIFSVAVAVLIFACKPEPKTGQETGNPEITEESTKKAVNSDTSVSSSSEKKAEIDEFVEFVAKNQFKGEQGFSRSIVKPKGGGEEDKITVISQNGKIVKAVISIFTDVSETRDYYHFKNGKPLFYTHREWNHGVGQPDASEVIAYMDGDNVISLEERSVELGKGQNPSGMLSLPLQSSSMNRDSFLTVINQLWDTHRQGAGINAPIY